MFRSSSTNNNNYSAKVTRMYTAILGIFSQRPLSSKEVQKTIEACKKEHQQFRQLIEESDKINRDCENTLKNR